MIQSDLNVSIQKQTVEFLVAMNLSYGSWMMLCWNQQSGAIVMALAFGEPWGTWPVGDVEVWSL